MSELQWNFYCSCGESVMVCLDSDAVTDVAPCTVASWAFAAVNVDAVGVWMIFRVGQWASILFKRTERSLRSFPFFIKERNDLCVLFRSL